MPGAIVQRLLMMIQACGLVLVLLAMLMQTYGLYLASALIPHRPWRQWLDFRLRRAVFTMENLRLAREL